MSKIVLLVEGQTEVMLREWLKVWLDAKCEQSGRPAVRLEVKPFAELLSPGKLKKRIELNLQSNDVLGVVAIIDVKCSSRTPFEDSAAAIKFLSAGLENEPRYRAHAAQYEVEAWLLPFWDSVCKKLKQKMQAPGANPEQVDHDKPPSHHLKQLYRKADRHYDKTRDGPAIAKGKDIEVAAAKCPNLKKLLDSIWFFANLTASPID